MNAIFWQMPAYAFYIKKLLNRLVLVPFYSPSILIIMNPHVTWAIARLINSVKDVARKFKTNPRISILIRNPFFNGFDNALLKRDLFKSLSFQEWLNSLSANCPTQAVNLFPMLNLNFFSV
jgi:hypothetical protein